MLTAAIIGGLAVPRAQFPATRNHGPNDRYDPQAYTVTQTISYWPGTSGNHVVYCNAIGGSPIPWPAREDAASDFALEADVKKMGPASVSSALFLSSRAGFGDGALEGVLVYWDNSKNNKKGGQISITLFCEPD